MHKICILWFLLCIKPYFICYNTGTNLSLRNSPWIISVAQLNSRARVRFHQVYQNSWLVRPCFHRSESLIGQMTKSTKADKWLTENCRLATSSNEPSESAKKNLSIYWKQFYFSSTFWDFYYQRLLMVFSCYDLSKPLSYYSVIHLFINLFTYTKLKYKILRGSTENHEANRISLSPLHCSTNQKIIERHFETN